MRFLKRKLARYKWFFPLRELVWNFTGVLKNLNKTYRKYQCDTLEPEKPSRGNVLLSFFNTIGRDHVPAHILLSPPDQPIPSRHPAEWMCLQIARTFLDMNYIVDLISWKNDQFVPQKPYSVFIDVRHNMERLVPLLNKDCLKIQHIDLCHMLYNNYAEARRLLELQQRKGVILGPRRFERPNLGIEHADCATILGNEFTINTFRYANKPLYRVPVADDVLYPSPEGKDFERCRRRYLWLGSAGFVRKGLDLVLDAFAEMPDYSLTVCGPVQQEEDFQAAYHRELYETPNIHTVGWVNTNSPEFLEITRQCVSLIYPSAAEGQCGGVVTCLHAGLIPIISYESGVDVDDFGLILKNCSIQEIQSAVRQVSSLSAQELELRARKAWEYAQTHHTQEKFAQEYRKAIETIIATHGKKKSPVEISTSGDAVGTSHRTSPSPSLASATLNRLNLS